MNHQKFLAVQLAQSRFQLSERDTQRVLDHSASYFSGLAYVQYGDSVRFLIPQFDEILNCNLGDIVELEAVLNPTGHAIRQESGHILDSDARQTHLRLADVFG